MADVAHDLPGPASPKPSDIAAPQQAGRPDSPDSGKLRVFISYSRDDLHFADQLDAALNAYGFECIIDRHGISGGEDWKRRLGNLIGEADTVVFVLSPTSARSPVCTWEVEEATRLGKRILPANCRPLEGTSPPPRLRDLNYIFFHEDPKAAPGAGFGTGLAKLVAALNTDFDWLREHTRYLQRATEWDRGGRPANRLLSGDDITEAKAWAARRPKSAPEPTALHLDFIRASEEEAEARSSAQRKQLEEMAAAQAERETALRKAEEAQRKRATMARIRNIALVAVSILTLLAGWLFWRAEQERITEVELRGVAEKQKAVAEEQRAVAEEQRGQADRILAGATTIFLRFRDQMDDDTKKAVFAVFQAGAEHGDASAMNALGQFYRDGFGVAQDFAKAREWYKNAADKGAPDAISHLVRLPIQEAAAAGDYAQALQMEERFAAAIEAEEIKEEGKPGTATAMNLEGVAWRALLAREFTKASSVADRARALLPDDLSIETNRAHALMFLGHREEARALYLAHKGKPLPGQHGRLWERAIAQDFAEFRKAGLTHPMMADIEKELGVSP
jgi:TPR repeat protein